MRVTAWAFLALTTLGFLIREPTMTPWAALLTLTLCVASRLVETLGFGSGSIEHSRIVAMDDREHRIDGVDRWGVRYRLRLSEPDFRRIAPLVSR